MPFSRLRGPRFRVQSRFREQCRFPCFQGQDFAGNAVFQQRFRAQRRLPGGQCRFPGFPGKEFAGNAGFQVARAKISLAMPGSRPPGKDFPCNAGFRLGFKAWSQKFGASSLALRLGHRVSGSKLRVCGQGLEFKGSGRLVFLAFGCRLPPQLPPRQPPAAAPRSSPLQQPPTAAPSSCRPPAAEFRVPGLKSRVQDLKFNGLEFRV